jgi:hypothetical protein
MADHRSLTVRIPSPIYFEVAGLARADEQNLNSKFNQLILLGLDKHISLDAALRRLLSAEVVNAA